MWRPRRRTLRNYVKSDDREPFEDWIQGLRDGRIRGIIRVRLNRLQQGNFGNCASVGDGVHELKIDVGPGYRVYFGEDGDTIVLLIGGDKSTQASDIAGAKDLWRGYNA